MGLNPPPVLLPLLLFLLCVVSPGAAKTLNSTKVLAKFDQFSTFNKYLSETGVVREVDTRSSVTLVIPSNSLLDPVIASIGPSNLLVIADVLRYHCILQYLEISEMRTMTNTSGILLTTLLQTTGRAIQEHGFMNISVSKTGVIHLGLPQGPGFNASIVKSISQHPYDMSYLEIDHVLVPLGLGISQGAAGSVNNVTASLKSKGNFNTFLGLLGTTGVDSALKSMSAVTLLAPTDDAFKAVPPNTLASLTPAEKISLLQYHALPAYFTLGSLQAVTTPLPTVASASLGGFSLNVSATDKTVSFLTGLNKAELLETEMDNPPVAVYSINRVLLPPELFALATAPTPSEGPSPFPSPIESPVPAPGPSPSSTPSPSPSPSPSSTPSPAPAPVLVPVASPPAPPTETPGSSLAPESVSPSTTPSDSGAPSVVVSNKLGGVLAGAASIIALSLL